MIVNGNRPNNIINNEIERIYNKSKYTKSEIKSLSRLYKKCDISKMKKEKAFTGTYNEKNKYKHNDPDYLVKNYLRLAVSLTNKIMLKSGLMNNTYTKYDDVLCNAFFGLCEAAYRYCNNTFHKRPIFFIYAKSYISKRVYEMIYTSSERMSMTFRDSLKQFENKDITFISRDITLIDGSSLDDDIKGNLVPFYDSIENNSVNYSLKEILVEELLCKLKPLEADIICLKYGIGCTPLEVKTIATRLELSASTVSVKLSRGIKKLQSLVKKEYSEKEVKNIKQLI